MHCPKCGQHQLSDETRFCSRCGFLLTGITKVIANEGVLPGDASTDDGVITPRWRGIKQGLFIFLLSFLIVPLIALITVSLRLPPFGIGFVAILLSVGGLLRVAYALMFESNQPGSRTFEQNLMAVSNKVLGTQLPQKELPMGESIPVGVYNPPSTGMWRDTNDLEPLSVTDTTTKLLAKEQDPQ